MFGSKDNSSSQNPEHAENRPRVNIPEDITIESIQAKYSLIESLLYRYLEKEKIKEPYGDAIRYFIKIFHELNIITEQLYKFLAISESNKISVDQIKVLTSTLLQYYKLFDVIYWVFSLNENYSVTKRSGQTSNYVSIFDIRPKHQEATLRVARGTYRAPNERISIYLVKDDVKNDEGIKKGKKIVFQIKDGLGYDYGIRIDVGAKRGEDTMMLIKNLCYDLFFRDSETISREDYFSELTTGTSISYTYHANLTNNEKINNKLADNLFEKMYEFLILFLGYEEKK